MRFGETFAMMLLVAGAASLATGMIVEKRAGDRLGAMLAERPPIAVLDYGFILGAMKAGRPLADVQAGFAEIEAAGDELAAQGYLVLTTAQIVKAPGDRIVGGPEIAGVQTVPAPPGTTLDLSGLVDGLSTGQGRVQ